MSAVPDAPVPDVSAPDDDRRSGADASTSVRSAAPVVAGRRRRRWHRIAIPLGAVAVLLAVTGITQAIDQPSPGSAGFLSPVNADDEGGSRLADRLRAEGVAVERFTSTRQALIQATSRGFTLFVPSPGLVHPLYLPYLAEPADRARVVLVDPPQRVLDGAELPLAATGRRWAAGAVDADADGRPCPLPEAARAGPAAALLQRYANPPGLDNRTDYCYSGGLVRTERRDSEVVVIGASDPFRNDRIAERGNAVLATGLLGSHDRVVWLDLAGPEPPPPYHRNGELDPWTSMPDDSGTYDDGESQEGNGTPEYDGRQQPAPGQDEQAAPPEPRNPLWDAFPPWFWALLAQLALALLLVVLWRARRLGPPVAEPLPVTVPSAETVLGRGRLYQRARAYGPAAETLRAAALHRLTQSRGVPPDAGPDELAAAVAARTGRGAAEVHDLLYGPAPETNQELLDLARALDDLAAASGTSLGTSPPDQPRHDRPSEGDAR
ncbi:DUF4350 domain-containing protein [Plantactinospora mayteni]|uniref:DUF4350 domain-containing protein n=1 Tax=Plantactinospora mayteni TaxID=566021 RepID=A0ABQ4ES49_9ACTN|nr:DUF4350 domain-containing protein [Plantactinospora mayteni]GIG97445.1 hypothetical protein Pma05_40180 [Plantactinospora mayteni]